MAFPAILLGLAVARISPRLWPRLVPAVVVVALAAGAVALAFRFEASATVDYGPVVDAVIPANGCSLSSHPQVLVQGDRFVSTVPGCTAMVDPYSAGWSSGTAREGRCRCSPPRSTTPTTWWPRRT